MASYGKIPDPEIKLALPTLSRLSASISNIRDVDASIVGKKWLAGFANALEAGDASAVANFFLNNSVDSFWRDMLALTWDFRTFIGHSRIHKFLSDILPSSTLKNFTLDEQRISLKTPYPDICWIEGLFTFNTKVAIASGVFRLVPTGVINNSEIDSDKWKAHVVYTNLEGLIGHPERVGPLRSFVSSQGSAWVADLQRKAEFIDQEPTVVVIGGGQAGLGVSARLQTLGISTLILERSSRIGDQWRGRYDALCLHDPVWYDHMPFLPFPPTWPVWTPAPKLADWLESYAHTMELNVWLGATVNKINHAPGSKEDIVQFDWVVHVTRNDGSNRILRPRYLIFAHGLFGGDPNMPNIPGMDKFEGKISHSSQHHTAKGFENRKVVVVGSCTSAHDIASDFARNNIDVTMIQRGPTYIMSTKEGMYRLNKDSYWEGGPPTDVADRLSASFPHLLVKLLHQRLALEIADADSELLDGLRRRGFKLTMGEDDSGVHMLWVRRGGGYYFDTGASQMIIDGRIKLKNNSDISHFSSDAVVFKDGSSISADDVILATGYKEPRHLVRKLCGEDVADRVNPIWGLNDEGETNTVWRFSGIANLYFMMGNLSLCRFYSKHIALQIKAKEVGVLGERYTS